MRLAIVSKAIIASFFAAAASISNVGAQEVFAVKKQPWDHYPTVANYQIIRADKVVANVLLDCGNQPSSEFHLIIHGKDDFCAAHSDGNGGWKFFKYGPLTQLSACKAIESLPSELLPSNLCRPGTPNVDVMKQIANERLISMGLSDPRQ